MTSRKLKIFLALGAPIFALKWWSIPPSEAQMKARFTQHRIDFEELRRMVETDAASAPIHTFQDSIQKDDGSSLPPERARKYYSLMKELHIWRTDGDKDGFHLYAFGGGFMDTSWSIGYAFKRHRPKKIVPSAYKRQFVRDTTVYSPRGGSWYLYQLR